MFALTNARGETVDINNDKLLSYTPTGLGVQFTNTYSQYETYFKATKSTVTQGQFQIYILFGDVESQAYQTFSDFAQFLAYQPLTLTYTTDSGTWYRDGRLNSLTKTEIGGSTVFATDRINESFTLEFINNWYNNKTAEYKSYDPDPNLGIYGKIYRPKYDPTVNRNLLLNSRNLDFDYGFNLAGQAEKISYDENTNMWHITAEKGTGTNVGIYYHATSTPLTTGQKVVFSYDIKGTGDYGLTGVENADHAIIPNGSVPSNWTRVSASGTVPKDGAAIVLYFDTSNSNLDVYIKLPKLEIGTVATDWSPAPEDNPVIPFGYAYAPYYVYQESNRPSNEKVMSLNNKSQYFGLQSGSPSVITVKGPCSVNPTWTVVQKGNVSATDGFVLTLTDNQKLVVSSYPEDQYARLYNPDGSYVDVSQLQDYTKTNFVQIPEGESTVLFYLDADSDVNITFKEERLLV